MLVKPTQVVIVSLILIVFTSLTLLPLPWNEPVENLLINLQFRVRGERHLSDDFVFVFIGADDVKELGGWPITRDYYGYVTHILTRLNAKAIGLYFMLDTPDARYPEYDALLANFLKSSDRVCLPMAFQELVTHHVDLDYYGMSGQPTLLGQQPIYPIPEFGKPAAAIGFSNLDQGVWHPKAPLFAFFAGDPPAKQRAQIVSSFGFALASLYTNGPDRFEENFSLPPSSIPINVPADEHGRLRLNHFGGPDQVNSIGLVDLLQIFESTPDSLDLDGKIVIVDVTAPGVATLESTPLASALPASLIHATVAENIIHKNFLRTLSPPWETLTVFFIVLAAWLISQIGTSRARLIAVAGLISGFWIVAHALFGKANLALPLFYPSLAYLATIAGMALLQTRQRHSEHEKLRSLLEEEITDKENDLETARADLTELQDRLKTETHASDETRLLAQERRETILTLEKQLSDLQAYSVEEPASSVQRFAEIIHADDSKMVHVLDLVSKVASDDIPVLISGETGTGKEMVARAIHQSSQRKAAPFVAINCGALPETLLDSELFGHEKGSFTGAQSRRKGRFELANGGTLFLDEITETSAAFQARLLRVLQEQTFERVGGERSITVDVRIIAATNKGLQTLVNQNGFRSDLYYRLNGFPIHLPPLRDRPEDVPLLMTHFLKKHNHQTITGVSDQAVHILQSYGWPGNVRELENLVRRAALLAQSAGRSLIQQDDLPEEVLSANSSVEQSIEFRSLEDQILESLRSLQFSRSAIGKTAQVLGNRDRGTITEYFRGICFRELVRANFEVEAAAAAIAGVEDERTVENARLKIAGYLSSLDSADLNSDSPGNTGFTAQFKGLPKKFHPFLTQVIEHLQQSST